MEIREHTSYFYKRYLKRMVDCVLAALALIVLSPLIGLFALIVRIKLGSPVIFKQARPGKNEKVFHLYKFRSMTNAVDESGKLLPDNQRLTKFGKFLRASSIDELLELINIIKGDMSIVGPRPLSIFYLPHYSVEYRRRSEVRPGLTGLAQVSGRNNLDWDSRFALDIKYVDHVSFRGDLRIIFKTVSKVLKASDVTIRGTSRVKDFGPYSVLKEERNVTKKLRGMSYSEMGSYFWLGKDSRSVNKDVSFDWLPELADSCFTFSGRTALEIALRDILANRKVKKAYVPSYCSVSMLQPFFDLGIKIKFYNVSYRRGKFVYNFVKDHDCDVILIMNYFGIAAESTHKFIKQCKQENVMIIEDVTHSLLSKQAYSDDSDYLVASLRKWFAIPTGGWLSKKAGSLKIKPIYSGEDAVAGKIQGMKEKYDYLKERTGNKDNFLILQSQFDRDLIHVDRLLKIDQTSFDLLANLNISDVKQQRRKNIKVLINKLSDLDGVVMRIPRIDLTKDTPFYLPIFMSKKDRESLQSYLISNGIYCPVHWPEVMGADVGVRNDELSLVCDQRYRESDMHVIAKMIYSWYKSKMK